MLESANVFYTLAGNKQLMHTLHNTDKSYSSTEIYREVHTSYTHLTKYPLPCKSYDIKRQPLSIKYSSSESGKTPDEFFREGLLKKWLLSHYKLASHIPQSDWHITSYGSLHRSDTCCVQRLKQQTSLFENTHISFPLSILSQGILVDVLPSVPTLKIYHTIYTVK